MCGSEPMIWKPRPYEKLNEDYLSWQHCGAAALFFLNHHIVLASVDPSINIILALADFHDGQTFVQLRWAVWDARSVCNVGLGDQFWTGE